MFSEHDFLTPEECARTREIIWGLKSHWINRGHLMLPIFTLGTASYLDATEEDKSHYLQLAEKYNPILMSNFPGLYEKLIETLTNILGMPVAFEKTFGLPGFHLFLSCKCFESPIARIHFDRQYRLLKWEDYEEIDFDHPISFTCPVTVPSSPIGLNYWDIGDEFQDFSRGELEKLRESKEMHFIPYHLGKLFLHRGLTLHQVAPMIDIQETDERFTLQGHGLICDGIMRIYW